MTGHRETSIEKSTLMTFVNSGVRYTFVSPSATVHRGLCHASFDIVAADKMVDVVQLVRTSDCDSEGRGFESHHSP